MALHARVQKNGGDVSFAINQMKKNAVIIPLEEPILVESGKQYVRLRQIQKSISLIDVLIYVSALVHGLSLITTDNDFRGLPGIELI